MAELRDWARQLQRCDHPSVRDQPLHEIGQRRSAIKPASHGISVPSVQNTRHWHG